MNVLPTPSASSHAKNGTIQISLTKMMTPSDFSTTANRSRYRTTFPIVSSRSTIFVSPMSFLCSRCLFWLVSGCIPIQTTRTTFHVRESPVKFRHVAPIRSAAIRTKPARRDGACVEKPAISLLGIGGSPRLPFRGFCKQGVGAGPFLTQDAGIRWPSSMPCKCLPYVRFQRFDVWQRKSAS